MSGECPSPSKLPLPRPTIIKDHKPLAQDPVHWWWSVVIVVILVIVVVLGSVRGSVGAECRCGPGRGQATPPTDPRPPAGGIRTMIPSLYHRLTRTRHI